MNSLFGVSLTELPEQSAVQYRITIPNRVLQIDGDFICYYATCHEDEPWETMKRSAFSQIEHLRKLAGAEVANVHLTAKNSNKGGRYGQAILKEYQGTRQGKPKPKMLEQMRLELAGHKGNLFNAFYWSDREADDGMATMQTGNLKNSVIASKDKDLRMVTGWHMDWDTGELHDAGDYEKLILNRSKSSPKLVGYGQAFFYAQLLMGDQADNISGLPAVMPDVHEEILGKPIKKAKKCGAVLAHDLLKTCVSRYHAMQMIVKLYKAYGEQVGFTHWKTGEKVDYTDALRSEAQLLWMREAPDASAFTPVDIYI